MTWDHGPAVRLISVIHICRYIATLEGSSGKEAWKSALKPASVGRVADIREALSFRMDGFLLVYTTRRWTLLILALGCLPQQITGGKFDCKISSQRYRGGYLDIGLFYTHFPPKHTAEARVICSIICRNIISIFILIDVFRRLLPFSNSSEELYSLYTTPANLTSSNDRLRKGLSFYLCATSYEVMNVTLIGL